MKTMTTEKNEQDVRKEIESGIYRNCFLIYNRKSSDEPENQKNSIKYQILENSRFAFKERLPIASVSIQGFCLDGIISERHSGFKEDAELIFGKGGTVQYRIERPKFYMLVDFLNKGYFKGVVFLCWDRASRNKGDNNIIEKLMKQGIDFRFTLATYDKTSSGALHMDIDGMVAQHHSRVTSEKVSLNIRNQRSKGICTYKAPVGYLNTGSMEHKPQDPKRAPLVVQMYEKYGTGDWSLSDLARWANSQGMTMPPVRKKRTREEMLAEEADDGPAEVEAISRPVRANSVYKILTNPFYTGRIKNNEGKWIASASHGALISDALFESVQKLLHKKNVSIHYTEKLASPYRGLIRCIDCKRIYTPYTQKGIMYYSSRCREACQNTRRNFNISFLESEIGDLIQRLSFTEEELIELDDRRQDDPVQEAKRNTEIEQMDRKQRKIREDLNYLESNKLFLLRTCVYTPETYIEEELKLAHELANLQDEKQVFSVEMKEIVEDAKKLSELLKTLYLTYKKANSLEREEIIRKLFSELFLSENTLACKYKYGLQVLENRFVACGAPKTWISELLSSREQIKISIHEIGLLLKKN